MSTAPKIEYDLIYNAGPTSLRFHKDKTSRVKLLIGPFGTGKTSSAAYDLIECASTRVLPTKGKIRSRFAIIRNTYPELRDTTIRTYLDWWPDGIVGKYSQTAKSFLVKYEGKEIELLFKALDTPDDVRDLLSLELTGAHIDEAREISIDVFKGILGRVGRFPSLKDCKGQNPFKSPPQVILTTNYPDLEHWIYSNFVSAPIEGYSIYEQAQSENKHNLRPGYYEDLEKDYADRPDLLRTLVRGQWGVTVRGKAVYPEFQSNLHVGQTNILDTPVIRGWDNTGLSPACVITQQTATGQWLIHREVVGDDIGIIDFGEQVIQICNRMFGEKTQYTDYGDPAGSNRDSTRQSPADYLRRLNINIIDGIQTFKTRREVVAGRLTKLINGEPAIVINPACKRIVGGFEGGYAYPELGNTGEFRLDPEKNKYSHPHDALQYAATRMFYHEEEKAGKPIRSKMSIY
jgi:hypothetical protein